MSDKKNNGFRLKGNKFLFTYHDSNQHLSKEIIFEEVVNSLKSIDFKIISYYLVKESEININIKYYNDQRPGLHYHFYIEVEHETDKNRKVETTNPLFFDIYRDNKELRLHGNYITIGNLTKKNKENKFLTYDFDNLAVSSKEILKNTLKKQTLTSGYRTILYLLKQDRNPWSNLPTEFILNLDKLRESLNPNEDNNLAPLDIVRNENFPVCSEQDFFIEDNDDEENSYTIDKINKNKDIEKNRVLSEELLSKKLEKIQNIKTIENINELNFYLNSTTNKVCVLFVDSNIDTYANLRRELKSYYPTINKFYQETNQIDWVQDLKTVIKKNKSKLKKNTEVPTILIFHEINQKNSNELINEIIELIKNDNTNSINETKEFQAIFVFDIAKFVISNEEEQQNVIEFINQMQQITNVEKLIKKTELIKSSQIKNLKLELLQAFEFKSNITIIDNSTNIINIDNSINNLNYEQSQVSNMISMTDQVSKMSEKLTQLNQENIQLKEFMNQMFEEINALKQQVEINDLKKQVKIIGFKQQVKNKKIQ
jgi:hypothetical protein